jgi:glycosyltransferase involved in cell wall biosynthesis
MYPMSVLVLCKSNPHNDPRPSRMIDWLSEDYQVSVFAAGTFIPRNINPKELQRSEKPHGIQSKLKALLIKSYKLLLLGLRRFDDLIRLSIRYEYQAAERSDLNSFDFIVTHDILLLPLACDLANRNKSKLLFDAREYYPREFENNFLWRLLRQPFNKHLCKTYLHQCDKVITVSDGLAREYKKEYGIEAEVIMSLPKYHEIEPVLPQNNSIRLIYHGQVSPDRQIEKMIEVIDYLDDRFSLDLMLVPPAKLHWLYWQRIVSMAKRRARVRITPPVPMKEIVEITRHYDIGIFICPPTTFNLQYALPNKFFEYIQARLVVAIGPSIEMQKMVQKYQCGIVASDFEPQTLAKELNKIGYDQLVFYKCQSNVAALELNSNLSGIRVRTIVRNLLRN